jgi:D-arginine dehydrogenase
MTVSVGERYDFIIVGGGIAGVSASYFLAPHGRVLLLERESALAYHTTGRSAAIYTQAYGNATVRALTVAGHEFFTAPPDGFSDHALLGPRGALFIGRDDQLDALDQAAAVGSDLVDSIRRIDGAAACAILPVLRPDYVAGGVLEPDAMDIDVHALHQGFVRGIRDHGGTIMTGAEVLAVDRAGADWTVETPGGRWTTPIVVNAAGAWCDALAAMAGVDPVGLVPKRRTAVVFDPPADMTVDAWPLTIDVDEEFYFKPEAGKLMGSPADETPMPPCDVQPEELDIAIAIDRIQTATTMTVDRVSHRWAGLRSFVADKTPVAGFDPAAPGFFWLAGQGGYGIQTAPALGRITADLARGKDLPAEIGDFGLTAAGLSPTRAGLRRT